MRFDLLMLVRFFALVVVASFLAASWLAMESGNRSVQRDTLATKLPGYRVPSLQLFQQETNGARSPELEER